MILYDLLNLCAEYIDSVDGNENLLFGFTVEPKQSFHWFIPYVQSLMMKGREVSFRMARSNRMRLLYSVPVPLSFGVL